MAEINKLSVEKALQKLCESDPLKSKNAGSTKKMGNLLKK